MRHFWTSFEATFWRYTDLLPTFWPKSHFLPSFIIKMAPKMFQILVHFCIFCSPHIFFISPKRAKISGFSFQTGPDVGTRLDIFEANFSLKSHMPERRKAACQTPELAFTKAPVVNPLSTGPRNFWKKYFSRRARKSK